MTHPQLDSLVAVWQAQDGDTRGERNRRPASFWSRAVANRHVKGYALKSRVSLIIAIQEQMTARNRLTTAPPYAVEAALKQLGSHLRTARLRRNLTIQNVADKIGTGPRAVSDAERGKPSTSVAVYVALLWAYDLLDPLNDVAAPALDAVGLAMSLPPDDARAREKKALDDDF